MPQDIIESIPSSNTDKLLRARGYDLLREYLEIIIRSNLTPGQIVELATGTGRTAAILSRLGFSVFTGDITPAKLADVLRRATPAYMDRVSCSLLNMERLPFRDNSLRTIISLNTIHELQKPKLCLSELRRVVHPEGILVIGDFNGRGFDVMDEVHRIVFGEDHGRGSFSIREVRKEMARQFESIGVLETPMNICYLLKRKKS